METQYSTPDSTHNFLFSGALLYHDTYRIESVLGQGGFGITYLATDLNLNKLVAIKEFFPSAYCSRDWTNSTMRVDTEGNVALIDRFREKFIKEAQRIASLDHPNIVRIYAAFRQNNTAYYVMDYIEGNTVADIVRHNGPLPENTTVDYIRKIGMALDYLHSRHINHLDVKPANIMLRAGDGEPVLIDFGLAKQYDRDGQQTSTTPVGVSHGYAPIEQYRPGGVAVFSPQTDIYSLAATLFFMLVGQTPPHASDLANESLQFPSSINRRIAAAISKAMSPRISDRQPSVDSFLGELAAGSTQKAKKRPRPASPKAERPRSGSKKWIWIVSILIILLIGAATFMLTNPSLSDNESSENSNLASSSDYYITPELAEKLRQYEDFGTPSEGFIPVGINNKWGFVDMNGEKITDLKYDIVHPFTEGFASVAIEGGKDERGHIYYQNYKWGFIDKNGKEVIGFEYDGVNNFSEGLAAVEKNGKWGFIDKDNKKVIGLEYDGVNDFSERLAAVYKNGKWGFIDKDNKKVIGLEYEDVNDFSEGLAAVKKNDKWGFIDKDGNPVTDLKYDHARPFSEGLAAVEENEEYGFIDKNGKPVTDLKYDYVLPFSEGLAKVMKNDKWGFIDNNGNEVITPQFVKVESFRGGLTVVYDESSPGWGAIDKYGNFIIKPTYSHMGVFNDGIARVSIISDLRLDEEGYITNSDHLWGLVDKKGNTTFTDEQLKKHEEFRKQFIEFGNKN